MPQAIVATFNIRHGRGMDDRVDLERIADVIDRSKAELIGLQELDRFNPRSGGADQPAELERLTGFRIAFAPTLARNGWEYGLGLAFRGDDVGFFEAFDLPRRGTEEPRKAIVAEWRGLRVITTHLALERAPNLAQQGALRDLIAPRAARTVVLGDLNAPARGVRGLTELGLTEARPFGGTLNPWWRFRQIDHVLVGSKLRLRGARTVPSRASDHRALVASLRWGVAHVADVTYDA